MCKYLVWLNHLAQRPQGGRALGVSHPSKLQLYSCLLLVVDKTKQAKHVNELHEWLSKNRV